MPIGQRDLIEYAPFSEKRVGRDASVAELCEAAVTLSDNSAANLLLQRRWAGRLALPAICGRWAIR